MAELDSPAEADADRYVPVEDPVGEEALDAWIDGLTAAADVAELTRAEFRYGSDSQQVADLWLPAGVGPFPTVVLIHGGGFLPNFTKEIMTATVVDLVRRGFAVWSVEYRRTDLGGGPYTTTADVADAMARMSGLGEFVDAARVVVLGHSAGAYLALWAAGLPQVSRVVALAPVCDLRVNAVSRGDGYSRFMGGTADDVPENYAYLDLAVRPASRASQVLIWGELDPRVEESRRHAAQALAKGERLRCEQIPDTGHFAFLDPRSRGWARAVAAVESILVGSG